MDLIDRGALRKELAYMWYDNMNATAEDVEKRIFDAPTVDAEPVRHGKIIETIKDGKHHREFSCCGRDFTQLTMWYMPRFCPNCGAIMEIEQEPAEQMHLF